MNLINQELLKELIDGDDDIIKINNEDCYLFNPYNPLNKQITLPEVQNILVKYGLPNKTVENFELYRRAFIHRSYTKRPSLENFTQQIKIMECPNDCISLSTKSNERLEFLGDGVLELITKYYLYRRFPKENEGFMTSKKIAVVKNEAIGRIALEMGLHKWLIISRHAEEKDIRTNLKRLGCLFEAFLGALFLDANKMKTIKDDFPGVSGIDDEDRWLNAPFICGPGFQVVQIFVESIFEQHIDWTALVQNDDNYKNLLQVRIQKEFKITPKYAIITQNPDIGYHMGVYLCYGKINHMQPILQKEHFTIFQDVIDYIAINGSINLLMGTGQHKIKQKAAQRACSQALAYFFPDVAIVN